MDAMEIILKIRAAECDHWKSRAELAERERDILKIERE